MVTLVTCSPCSLFCQLQCWSAGSALLGQHWDFHGRTRGHSRSWEAGTEQDWGKPPLNLCLFPFPSPHSPDLAGNNLSLLCEPWAPLEFQCQSEPTIPQGARYFCPKSCPTGPVSSPGPSVSPQPKPRPWGEEMAACPSKHLAAPAASGDAVGALCQPRALCPSWALHPPQPEPWPWCAGLGCSQPWGVGRKLTALSRVCTRLNTDLGAFLEYKGAWETSATVRDQPDKRSYEHEKCADCRALKMPGYLFLLDKADKQRTKDLGLCNLGCSSLAMILRCSQGGGERMSSSKRQLQLLSSPRAAVQRPLPASVPSAGHTMVPGSEWPPAPSWGTPGMVPLSAGTAELCKPADTTMALGPDRKSVV